MEVDIPLLRASPPWTNHPAFKNPLPCRHHAIDGATYTIPAEAMSTDLKNFLRLHPKESKRRRGDRGTSTKSFNVWTNVGSNAVQVPRLVGRQLFGTARRSIAVEGRALDGTVAFNGTLKPFQDTVVCAVLDRLRGSEAKSGLLVADCGCGKTVMALSVIVALGRRAAVLVHTSTLAEQWVARAATFVPAARVARVGCGVADPGDFDIVIAMVQTVARGGTDLSSCGLVVLDECHHIAAPFFSRVLCRVPAVYRLGLSATPDRSDGLGPALSFLIGPVLASVRRKSETSPLRVVQMNYSGCIEVPKDRFGDIAYSQLINRVAAETNRNMEIAGVVSKAYQDGRKTLVLSDRRGHLADLMRLTTEEFMVPESDQMLLVGVTGKKRCAQRDARVPLAKVLFASYGMASEGADIRGLSVLILATPRKSENTIRQVLGRLQRTQGASSEIQSLPTVVDVVDCKVNTLKNMAMTRKRVYRSIVAAGVQEHSSGATVSFS